MPKFTMKNLLLILIIIFVIYSIDKSRAGGFVSSLLGGMSTVLTSVGSSLQTIMKK